MKKRLSKLFVLLTVVAMCAFSTVLIGCTSAHECDGEWTVTKQPTCTQTGTRTRTCTEKGCKHTETDIINALGHDLHENGIDNSTCAQDGKVTLKCSRCDYTEEVKIDAHGHAVYTDCVDSPCLICGEVLPASAEHDLSTNNGVVECSKCDLKYSDGLNYTLNADEKSYSVRDNWQAKAPEIIIPAYHEGLPVTAVSGFSYDNDLWKVTLPDTIETIADYAFNSCANLRSINVPASVKSIGTNFLNGSVLLTKLTSSAQNGLVYIDGWCIGVTENATKVELRDDTRGVMPGIFKNHAALTEVVLKKMTAIEDNCFQGCTALTKVTIPSEVVSIGTTAFANCTDLATIEYDGNPTKIGRNAIANTAFYNNITPENGLKYWRNFVVGVDDAEMTATTVKAGTIGLAAYAFAVTNDNGSSVAHPTLTSITLPNTLKYVGDYAFFGFKGTSVDLTATSVETIGGYAFQQSAITSFTAPKTLKEIGSYAFSSCGALTNADFSATSIKTVPSYLFSNLSALASVKLPDSVERIEGCAFNNAGITEFVAPKSLSYIAGPVGVKTTYGVFQGCNSLVKVDLSGAKLTEVPSKCFMQCTKLAEVKLPSTITVIKASAFQSSVITTIVVPEGVTTLEGSVFASCAALTEVKLPSTLTEMGSSVFSNCELLSKINIPDAITSIGDSLFMNCKALQTVKLPNGVTSIGNSAFSGCTALTTVDYDGELTFIGKELFKDTALLANTTPDNCIIYWGKYVLGIQVSEENPLVTATIKDGTIGIAGYAFTVPGQYTWQVYGCTTLTEVTLPSSIKFIGDYAFNKCSALAKADISKTQITKIGNYCFAETALTSIVMPDTLREIGDYAFNACKSLTTVTFNSGLEKLSNNCFWNCSSITTVDLPASVKTIGSMAFSGCSALKTVDVRGDGMDIGGNAFANLAPNAKITLHGNSVPKTGYASFNSVNVVVRVPAAIKDECEALFSSSTAFGYSPTGKVEAI